MSYISKWSGMDKYRGTLKYNQGCHIWVGSKFSDISLTIPWHIAIFPWQFILFFQVKNKNYPQKQFKGPIFVLNIFATKELM